MAVNLLHFIMQLLVAGFIIRYVEIKTAGTAFGSALSYAY